MLLKNLTVSADKTSGQDACIVTDASVEVVAGETTVLVGQSGCGKSTLLASALDVLPAGLTRVSGDVVLDGESLLSAERAMRSARGRRLALVFQEPGAALNPALSIGRHFRDVIVRSAGHWKTRALDLLAEVGISDGAKRLPQHLHQLSGGERQRVVIALAISNNPSYLLADEPTSALDGVTADRVLSLLKRLRDSRGMGLLIVTHDWRVVVNHADHVMVMSNGSVVERGTADVVLGAPSHPETLRLLAAAQPQEKTND